MTAAMVEERDPYAAVMAELLSDKAIRIVAPAATAGSAIRSLTARQVLYRPGSRVTVTYRATLEWSDGRQVDELIVAAADRDGLPRGAETSSAGQEPVAVWRAPRDPLLPGMERALDPGFAMRLLTDAGVRARSARLMLRAYRPGRRAVVEVSPVQPEQRKLVFTRAAGTLRAASSQEEPALYLKVLPPDRAPEVAAVHQRLLPHVPAPPCEIADASGILRLGLLRGASLGRCLRRGIPRAPDPGELIELLERLDRAGLQGAPEAGSDASLRRYTRLLRALVPEEAERLERLRAALRGAQTQPTVTIHGDFHEGNILVGDNGVSGLLDVDDAGPGERVEDLGLLIGRIWSLAHGRAGEPALRYADALLRRSDAQVDPGELRRRVGVALIGRATAPFRNQLQNWRPETRSRLALAERWVTSVAEALR
jgi:hypothetical protein